MKPNEQKEEGKKTERDNNLSVFAKNLEINSFNPSTKLLEKRRMMYEVHEAFEQEKASFKKKEETFKKRESELKEKDFEIQNSLLKFSKYLTDIQTKTQRAVKKISEENKSIKEKTEELNLKKKSLDETKINFEKLEKKLDHIKVYQEFLEKFLIQYGDEFSDINEVISRYNVLKSTNQKLLQKQEFLQQEIEGLQKNSLEFEREKGKEIYMIKNDIEMQKSKFENAKSDKYDIQKKVEIITADARNKTMEVGQLLMAINNMYETCRKERPNIQRRIPNEKTNCIHYDNIRERSQIIRNYCRKSISRNSRIH